LKDFSETHTYESQKIGRTMEAMAIPESQA
jgi:hypothetical protein